MAILRIKCKNSDWINHYEDQVSAINPVQIADSISNTLSSYFGKIDKEIFQFKGIDKIYTCAIHGLFDEQVQQAVLMDVQEKQKRRWSGNTEEIKYTTKINVYLPPSNPFEFSSENNVNIQEIISALKGTLAEEKTKNPQMRVQCGTGIFLSYIK